MITREGLKYGIIFVLTASTYNDIRYRLAQNFKQQFALQVNNEDEYYNIFDKIGKKRPSQLFGRGLIRIDEVVQEFQTARITNAEEWNNKIKDEIDGLRKSYITSARQVPTIPDSVEIEDVKGYLKDLSSVPIGLAKRTLSVYGWDFEKNFTTLVTAKNIDSILPFMINVIEEFKMFPNLDITVLDAERLIKKTKEELEADYKKFKETIESNNNNYNICVFLGVEKLINDLEGGENELFELIKKCEDKDNYRFVFVDNANRIKNHEYDSWFKNYVNKEDGIWIGNGIDDQYLINITGNRRDIVNNCGNSYGYVVKQGQQELIKLLGIKEDN